jgi:hypothetical protein
MKPIMKPQLVGILPAETITSEKLRLLCHGDVGSGNPHFDIDSIPTKNIPFSDTML